MLIETCLDIGIAFVVRGNIEAAPLKFLISKAMYRVSEYQIYFEQADWSEGDDDRASTVRNLAGGDQVLIVEFLEL